MERLVKKYAGKLIQAGLGESSGTHQPLVGGLDDVLTWNLPGAPEQPVLEQVFSGLNINSLVFLRPRPPYTDIIRFLAGEALGAGRTIEPKDCETRTFLHDRPVISRFHPDQVIETLKKRKSVIISEPGHDPAVLAPGTVSPEQGFVTVSSVCFACFVKFFADYLDRLKTGKAGQAEHDLFDRAAKTLPPISQKLPELIPGPFDKEPDIYRAVIQAGAKTVGYDLVDSYFGNVSYCSDDILYISQTGSALDELASCIDPVPLDHSTSAGLTASSELTAHLKTIEKTGCRAILHGHPKFSVILSMDCDPEEKAACEFKDECHIKCPKKRFVETTPIVPGEVGTGPTGLCNTLPAALEDSQSAIVYGHGLFTTGKIDFSDAFAEMLRIEERCRQIYVEKVNQLRKIR